jgi:hypothetical protein
LLLLGACSSSESGAPPSSGQSPSDGGAVDASTGTEAASSSDGAIADTTSSEAAPPADAAQDAPAADTSPHPPPGATKCGGASFDANAARDACNAPFKLGGEINYSRACDALDISGGAYEVWCNPAGGVYFWVRYDGLKPKSPYECNVTLDGSVYPLYPPMYVQGAELEASSGARAEGGNATVRPAFSLLDPQRASTVVLDATASDLDGASGTASMWLVFVQSDCPGNPDKLPTIQSGAALTWP